MTREGQESFENNLKKLMKTVLCADENGLFKNRDEIRKSIVNDISDVRKILKQGQDKPQEAIRKYFSAYHDFNETENSARFWWRFTYSYGGPIILYFLAIIVSIFLAWFFFSNVILNSKMLWVPSWAFLWGSLGGILQGFWCLWQHVNNRCLRRNWFIWFLLLPLMGAVLGALIYLIYFAGFIVSTGGTQLTSESFAMLLSALAGFSSWWAVELLNTLTEMIQIKSASGRATQEV